MCRNDTTSLRGFKLVEEGVNMLRFIHPQGLTRQIEFFGFITVGQKAVMADARKAFGQDVLGRLVE